MMLTACKHVSIILTLWSNSVVCGASSICLLILAKQLVARVPTLLLPGRDAKYYDAAYLYVCFFCFRVSKIGAHTSNVYNIFMHVA